MRILRLVLAFLLVSLLCSSAATGSEAGASPEVRLLQIVEGREAGGGRLEAFLAPASPDPGVGLKAIVPGEVLGAQRTLVTFVNFANDPTVNYAPLDAENEIYDAAVATSAAAFVEEASYGRAWITKSTQVVAGQFSASYDDTQCLVATFSGTQQLIDDIGGALDFSQVDRWIVIIPQNPNCGFLGVSSLGKWTFDTPDQGTRSFSRVILNGPSLPWGPLVSHELGHSFGGLQHSEDWECGTAVVGAGCTATGTDRYDVMAASVNLGHFTPSGKHALEWFDTQITQVVGPGGTFLIEPYETTGAGIKALRIDAAGPYDAYRELDGYWVSYRKPLGFDAGFTELATDGAMLHLGTKFFPEYTTEATGPSLLLDAKPDSAGTQDADSQDVLLEVGQTFVDADRGITIETKGTVGSALEVEVTLAQYCGNGVRDTGIGEICDGTDLGPATCTNLGFTSGTLGCNASCDYDLSQCGPAVCEPGDTYDEGTGLCTASFLGAGPVDMGLYRNYIDWAQARTITTATLLTQGRGFLGLNQNLSGTNHIIHRLNLPFDTAPLPDGAVLDSATLHLTYDVFGAPYSNTHPSSADQLVLVQTSDPQPTVREKSDYGVFLPVDSPPEGAPRIDAGDTYVPGAPISFPLNATGLSWIDDTGFTRLGVRTGWDVDDVYLPLPDAVDFNVNIVPPDSPISGPRLAVTYQPLPEPGVLGGIASGALLLGWLRRRGERPQTTR